MAIAVCAAIAAAALFGGAGAANAGSGGVSPPVGSGPTVPGSKAKLRKDGSAVPPKSAPLAVKRAILAANKIKDKPYRHDGGHGSWYGRGYDCSGSVNFVLGKPGARLIKRPDKVSGDYATYGRKGRGKWITVYGNGGHVFAIIAGLRWDTSNPDRSSGPSWSRNKKYGFNNVARSAARHPLGL